MKTKLIVLSASLLLACSDGQKELDELCRKNAGTVIYKQVEADGYFDESCDYLCWSTLHYYRLKYIEMDNPKPNKYLKEKGLWRIYISESRDSFCNEAATDRYLDPLLNSNQCIATKRILKPVSKYSLKTQKEIININNFNNSVIGRFSTKIVNLNTNEIISETVSYQLDSKPGTTLDGGPYRCKNHSQRKEQVQNLVKATINSSKVSN